jgi:hypothetical protein
MKISCASGRENVALFACMFLAVDPKFNVLVGGDAIPHPRPLSLPIPEGRGVKKVASCVTSQRRSHNLVFELI